MTYIFYCPRCHRRGEVEATGGVRSWGEAVVHAHAGMSPGCKMPDRQVLNHCADAYLTWHELEFMKELKDRNPARFKRYAEALLRREAFDWTVNADEVRGAALRMLGELEDRKAHERLNGLRSGQIRHSACAGEWPEGADR